MMIFEKVNDDLKAAMKSGDAVTRDYIKVVKAELQRPKVQPPSDEECIKVFTKLKKNAVENGLDHEIEYLNNYLPTLMSESQIEVEVSKIILGKGLTNIGQVMGAFNKEFKGKADNRLVSQVVKQQLG